MYFKMTITLKNIFRKLLFYNSVCKESHRYLSVLFYGSDNFSLTSLKHILALKTGVNEGNTPLISHLEVVCKTKDLPVKTFAQENEIPIHFWPYFVPPNVFDIGVVVSFGHLIPQESIQAILNGMVNVHPSLLPRWRGAAPLHHTIISDDKVTGVSIVDVAPHRFDAGKILLQESLPVPHRTTLVQLSDLLAERGAQLLVQCLQDLKSYREKSWPQSTVGITSAPKVKPDMARVKWSSMTACQVDCLYRGLPFPLYTYWKGQKVRLLSLRDPEQTREIPFSTLLSQQGFKEEPWPGTCVFDKRRKVLGVLTGDHDSWVAFAQVICGQTMSARDFQNGYVSKVPIEQRFFTEGQEVT